MTEGGSVTTYDNIRAQKRLCERFLGLKNPFSHQLFNVGATGFSLGCGYPDMVESIADLWTAKTSRLASSGRDETGAAADSNWAGGDYEKPPEAGLRAFHGIERQIFSRHTSETESIEFLGTKAETMADFLENVHQSFRI